jgi:plasmid stabilization system protein ParE
MSEPYRVSFAAVALREIQRERTWLHDHHDLARADAFEAELRHALELIAAHPRMGDASPKSDDERHWLLRKSRVHVYYLVNHGRRVIRVVEILPEAWQTRRW